MKTAICLLFLCASLWAQSAAQPAIASADPALTQLLAELQVTALKADGDISRLRIDKWKTDSAMKQQAQSTANSIHRNLSAAVPELLQDIQLQPNSLNANFRLYRNTETLYDTFSSFVETVGAFGPSSEYTTLAAEASQMDQIRRELSKRMDLLTRTTDAELVHLRQPASAISAKRQSVSRIVVDDNQPVVKKKKKKKPTPPPPSQQ